MRHFIIEIEKLENKSVKLVGHHKDVFNVLTAIINIIENKSKKYNFVYISIPHSIYHEIQSGKYKKIIIQNIAEKELIEIWTKFHETFSICKNVILLDSSKKYRKEDLI